MVERWVVGNSLRGVGSNFDMTLLLFLCFEMDFYDL